MRRITSRKGNIFAMLFAAVAMTGVLGVVGMQTVSGPVTTITKVTQKNITDTDIMTNGRLIILNAVTLDPNADGDPEIEPIPFDSTCTSKPTGGGCIPATIGAVLTNPWGTPYGYCVWNHGTNDNSDSGTAVANMLQGRPDSDGAVVAIISAGPNKQFETSCYDYDGSDPQGLFPVPQQGMRAGGDDSAKFFTYAEAAAGAGGLWSIKNGTSDTATVAASTGVTQFEVGDGANTIRFDTTTGRGEFPSVKVDVLTAHTQANIELAGGLRLDADGAVSCTDGGVIRYNTTLKTVEVCDGSAFVRLSVWDVDASDNISYNAGNVSTTGSLTAGSLSTSGTLNAGTSTLGATTVSSLDAGSGAIQTTGTLNAGTTTLGATGVSSLNAGVGTIETTGELKGGTTTVSSLTVTNAATVGTDFTVNTDTLFVDSSTGRVGIGTISPLGNLSIQDNGGASEQALNIDGAAGAHREIAFTTDRALRWILGANNTAESGSNTGSDFYINSYNDAGAYLGSRLFIRRDGGQVGIGTLSPASKLQIAGAVQIGNDADSCNGTKAGAIRYNAPKLEYCNGTGWGALGGEIERLRDIGNVNITSDPVEGASIVWDDTNKKWVIGSVGSAITSVQAGRLSDDDDDTKILVDVNGDGSANTTVFVNNGIETMQIKPSGKIGIGVTDPKSLLQVAGAVQVGDDVDVCDATKAGAIRYSTGALQYCNGSSWVSTGTGGSGGGSGSGSVGDWVNVTASRSCGTNYTNDGDGIRQVVISAQGAGGGVTATVNGVAVKIMSGYSGSTNMTGTLLVPPGAIYNVGCASIATLQTWHELDGIGAGSGGGGIGEKQIDISYKYWTYNATDLDHTWYGPGTNFRNCLPVEAFQTEDTIQNTVVYSILSHVMGSDRSTWSGHPENAKFLRDFSTTYTTANSVYGSWAQPKYESSILYRCQVDDDTGFQKITVPVGYGSGGSSGSGGQGFRATVSANQSIATSTVTKVEFNTVVRDDLNGYDVSTDEFTAPADGWYQLSSHVQWDALVNTTLSGMNITAGGSAVCQSFGEGSSTDKIQTCSTAVYLTSGQTAHVKAWHYEGATKVIEAGAFSAVAIGGDGGGSSSGSGGTNASGMVVAFDASSCPSGWSEYVPARGRFLRGIDSTGTIDPDGVRTPGSIQEATRIQQSADPYYGAIGFANPDGTYAETYAGGRHAVGAANAYAGPNSAISVRPTNAAVIFCKFNGTTIGGGSGGSGSGGTLSSELITASGTYTVPAGVTRIRVSVAGAGGGGGVRNITGGTGGDTTFNGNGETLVATGGAGGTSGSGVTGTDHEAHGSGSGGDYTMDGRGALGGRPSHFYKSSPGADDASYAGGNGGLTVKSIDVTPGDTFTVTIGAGGIGNDNGGFVSEAGQDGYVLVEYGTGGGSGGSGSGVTLSGGALYMNKSVSLGSVSGGSAGSPTSFTVNPSDIPSDAASIILAAHYTTGTASETSGYLYVKSDNPNSTFVPVMYIKTYGANAYDENSVVFELPYGSTIQAYRTAGYNPTMSIIGYREKYSVSGGGSGSAGDPEVYVYATNAVADALTQSAWTKVNYDNEITSTDAYDETTGEFTAPHTGKYLVESSQYIGAYSTTQLLQSSIRVNGTEVDNNWSYAGASSVDPIVNQFAILDLSAGDVVTFHSWTNIASKSLLANDRVFIKILSLNNGGGGGSGSLTPGGFGAWETKSHTTTYQADTDGMVVATLGADLSDVCNIVGRTDSSSNPTTAVVTASAQDVTSHPRVITNSFTMPVKKGDYWNVGISSEAGDCGSGDDVNVRWLPITFTSGSSGSGGSGSGSGNALGVIGYAQRNDASSGVTIPVTKAIPTDGTIPQNDEGAELLTITVDVPEAADYIYFNLSGGNFREATNSGNDFTIALFEDGGSTSAIASRGFNTYMTNADSYLNRVNVDTMLRIPAPAAGTHTYKLRGSFSDTAATLQVNTGYGGTNISTGGQSQLTAIVMADNMGGSGSGSGTGSSTAQIVLSSGSKDGAADLQETIEIEADGVLHFTGYGAGSNYPYVVLYVDGVQCARDRDYNASGSMYNSATCIKDLTAGTHTIRSVYGETSGNANLAAHKMSWSVIAKTITVSGGGSGSGSGSGEAEVSFRAKGASTSIPSGAWTDMVHATQDFDNGGDNFNPTTGKFTAPSDGTYVFAATYAPSTSSGGAGVIIQTEDASTSGTRICYGYSPTASTSANINCTGTIELTAGQVVESIAFQNSGGTVPVNGVDSMFTGFKLNTGGSGGSGSGAGEAEVSFRASGSTQSLSTGAWTDVVNPNEIYDNGGDNYDPATGKFTAPSAGTYIFSATAYSNATSGRIGLIIQSDSASTNDADNVCLSLNDKSSTNSTATTCTGMVELVAGEKVEMIAFQESGSTTTLNNNYTSFSGFKLVSGSGSGSGSGGSSTPVDVSFAVNKNNVAQTVTSSTWTKLTWPTEEFDTANAFAGDKFTPQTAGKYLITANAQCSSSTGSCAVAIYKNGSTYTYTYENGNGSVGAAATAIVDMNGSTDYIEAYAYNGGGTSIHGSPAVTSLSGMLINGGGGSGGSGSGGSGAGVGAWVNFDGTDCTGGSGADCTIRNQYNVSSVTRVSAGVYTVNFDNPMSDTNYGYSISGVTSGMLSDYSLRNATSTATDSMQIRCGSGSWNGSTYVDVDKSHCSVTVFDNGVGGGSGSGSGSDLVVTSGERSETNAADQVTTTSNTWVNVPNLTKTFTSNGTKTFIQAVVPSYSNSAGANGHFRMLVDGTVVDTNTLQYVSSSNVQNAVMSVVENLAAGEHTVEVQWYTNSGTLNASWGGAERKIIIFEVDGVSGGSGGSGSGGTGGTSAGGMVVAFDATSCPSGWSEYTPARGRFLRGIDPTGAADPDGVRTPGSTQDDAIQDHRHAKGSDGNANGGYSIGASGNQTGGTGYQNTTTGLPIATTSGGTAVRTATETRPKNAAVIYCKFDGTTIGGSGAGTPGSLGSYEDITTFNSALTADSDGIVVMNGVDNSASGVCAIQIMVNGTEIAAQRSSSDEYNWISATAPVKKGDSYELRYSGSCSPVTAKWADLNFGTGGGSGSGSFTDTSKKLFTTCTNENSDGDTTDDIAACVAAASNGGRGDGNYEAFGCEYGSGYRVGGLLRYNSGAWEFYSGGWVNCTDGTMQVVDLNATSGVTVAGSGSGSGTEVAFSVHKNGTNQTGLTDSNWNKLTWSTEEFDTNNNFASDRFTATEAGKYQFNATARCASGTACGVGIFKNGVAVNTVYATVGDMGSNVTAVLDLAPSDYVEAHVRPTGTTTVYGGQMSTQFSGFKIGSGGGSGSGSGSSDTVSMVDGWPDAIQCSRADGTVDTYYVVHAPYGSNSNYYYRRIGTGSSIMGLRFNSDGSYNSDEGTTEQTNCSKSISQLYTDGQAFNFAGGGSGSGSGSGTEVAFSVNKGGTNQTVSSATWTKVTWPTEVYDTNNDFASDRFTPTVAGQYLVTAAAYCSDSTAQCNVYIYKNGSGFKQGYDAGSSAAPNVTALVDMDGATDYLEVYVYNSGGTTINGSSAMTYFDGVLVGGGGSGGSGSSGGVSTPLYTFCTNENSDGDTTDDKAACVGAATNEDGTGRYRALSCKTVGGSDNAAAGWVDWTGTTWRTAYAGSWYNCVDGTLIAIDTQATTGGGSGSGSGSSAVSMTCPSGFTKVEAQGQTLGCIQNAEQGNGTWSVASSACFTTYGGRLPSVDEWRNAVNTLTLTDETDAWEWTSDYSWHTNGQAAAVVGNGTVDAISLSIHPTATDYRCFIPAGANGSGGGSSGSGSGVDVSINVSAATKTIAQSTWTELDFTTETKDTNDNFDLGTNRFTPTVAGKYIVTATVACTNLQANQWCSATINKNGASIANDSSYANINGSAGFQNMSVIVDMNGTTDYVTVSANSNNTAPSVNGSMTSALLGSGGGAGSGSESGSGGVSKVSFLVNKGGANQTVTANTWAKLTWPVEVADSNDNFTSDRFTPTVAGTYAISLNLYCGSATNCLHGIKKNDNWVQVGRSVGAASSTNVTYIVDMNGTTDYIEAFGQSTGTTIDGTSYWTNFSGSLIGGGGSSGSGSGSSSPIFTRCTNEQSDGDGTGDVAACVEASTYDRQGSGDSNPTATAVPLSCMITGNTFAHMGGRSLYWDTSTSGWKVYFSSSAADTTASCDDGSVIIADLTATTGGGSGSDTLSGLSCTDGQVAAWDDAASAWKCADGGVGGSSATSMVDGWPDALVCSGASGSIILWQSYMQSNIMRYDYNLSSDHTVGFTAAGAPDAGSTNTTYAYATDCRNKSISQLYADGQAFNFVGGSASGSSSDAISFTATNGSTNVPNASWTDMVFSTEVSDTGGDNYDPTTGKFTAPSDGTYMFSATYDTVTGGSYIYLIIQTDASAIAGTQVCLSSTTNGTGETGVSCSGMIDLTAGQKVEVVVSQSSGSAQAPTAARTTFSGFKVGSGGGSDTLAGLSCTDGQVPAWDNATSAWKCADGGFGGSGSLTGSTTADWGYKEGPTSLSSDLVSVWNNGGGSGGSIDCTSSTTGCTILEDGIYEATCMQRSTAATGYTILGLNGSRSALEDKAGTMWNHDHGSGDGDMTRSEFIGALSANDFLTCGTGTADTAKVQYNAGGWAGAMKIKRIDQAIDITGGASGGSSSAVKFKVHRNGAGQTVSSGVYTTVDFTTKEFDNTNAFDTATDRFTPQVAGTYMIGGAVYCASGATSCEVVIRKNGSIISNTYSESNTPAIPTIVMVDMNGTTDYIDMQAKNAGGTVLGGAVWNTHLYGYLIGGGGSGSDTLSGLSCTDGQVAAWDNATSAWKCADGGTGSGGSGGVAAWVNFNGSDGSIRGSSNVSSVTRNSTGVYTINFETPMSSANYAVFGSASGVYNGTVITTDGAADAAPTPRTTTSVQINTRGAEGPGGGTVYDPAYVNVAIISGAANGGGSGGGANVGFTASLSTTFPTASFTQFTGFTAGRNDGGHFNASTGVFTAPSAGYYSFSALAFISSASAYADISIYSPGPTINEICRSFEAPGANNYYSGCSGVAYLQANETVGVYGSNGSAVSGRVDFRGVKLNTGGSGSGGSDNLGDHTATQDLDLATYDLLNAGSIELETVTGANAPVGGSGAWSVDGSGNVYRTTGNVGIGISDPQEAMHFGAGRSTTAAIRIDRNDGVARHTLIGHDSDGTYFQVSSGDTYSFKDNAGNRVAVLNPTTGNLSLGVDSTSYKLHVAGTAYATGAAGALSDRRHKHNIQSIEDGALDTVLRLRPVTFEWNDVYDSGMAGEQLGFIAQEVEEVLPSVVLTQDNDEKTKGLKMTELLPVLTKAVQELSAENNKLKSAIEQLSGGEITVADLSSTSDKGGDLPQWLIILLGLQSVAIIGLMVVVIRRKK